MTSENYPALLRPLDKDLPPEVRQLASSLRVLFGGLEISVRRYAARRSRDAGAVSRYLNGSRLAPWEFILELARDVASHRGESVKAEALEFLRVQHRAAVATQGNSADLLRMVELQLAEADRMAQQSQIQVQVLTDALQDRQILLDDVELQLRQIQNQDATRALLVDDLIEERDELLGERDRLRTEVDSLEGKLSAARVRAAKAEAECASLESRLASLDENQGRELTAGSMVFGMLEVSGFRRLTQRLTNSELISAVENLRDACQEVSLNTGARFTYARGSEVSFTSFSAAAGAEAGLQLIEMKDSKGLEVEIRIGLCYGQVHSLREVAFGETVSIAEALCDVAPKNGVLVSPSFISQLELEKGSASTDPGFPQVSMMAMWQRPVRGLGIIEPWLISRSDVEPASLDP
ncbi:hypothetical protein ACFY0G_10250 [Streptomyces sp. NPDC001552]|uniref:hypothetical protein n=1 Tax=Streptomyces sp. NPDC001552 TaxID=3364587 RepID=UPI0036B6DAC0